MKYYDQNIYPITESRIWVQISVNHIQAHSFYRSKFAIRSLTMKKRNDYE